MTVKSYSNIWQSLSKFTVPAVQSMPRVCHKCAVIKYFKWLFMHMVYIKSVVQMQFSMATIQFDIEIRTSFNWKNYNLLSK